MTLAWMAALSLVAAAPPAAAEPERAVPTGAAESRYCLRVEALVGTLVERVRCWTRRQWQEQGVDVDAEWAKNGVRVEP